jgi:hypothetical protein
MSIAADAAPVRSPVKLGCGCTYTSNRCCLSSTPPCTGWLQCHPSSIQRRRLPPPPLPPPLSPIAAPGAGRPLACCWRGGAPPSLPAAPLAEAPAPRARLLHAANASGMPSSLAHSVLLTAWAGRRPAARSNHARHTASWRSGPFTRNSMATCGTCSASAHARPAAAALLLASPSCRAPWAAPRACAPHVAASSSSARRARRLCRCCMDVQVATRTRAGTSARSSVRNRDCCCRGVISWHGGLAPPLLLGGLPASSLLDPLLPSPSAASFKEAGVQGVDRPLLLSIGRRSASGSDRVKRCFPA